MDRRLLAPLLGLGLAVAVVGGIVLASGRDDGEIVVLDEPGEYQQPGIGTNAPLAGSPLAPATVRDLEGNEVEVSSLTGEPLVINVWFSACPPCKRELPTFAAAHATYGDRVRFVGINTQDSAELTRSFAASLGVTYELLRDPDGEFLVANGIAAFPTTLLVAPDGIVVRQRAGEMSQAELEAAIEELLG